MERDEEVQCPMMGPSLSQKHKGKVMCTCVLGVEGRMSAGESTLLPEPSTAQATPPPLKHLRSSLMSSDSRAVTHSLHGHCFLGQDLPWLLITTEDNAYEGLTPVLVTGVIFGSTFQWGSGLGLPLNRWFLCIPSPTCPQKEYTSLLHRCRTCPRYPPLPHTG